MDLGLVLNKNLILKQEPNEQKRKSKKYANISTYGYIYIHNIPIKLEMR